MKRMTERKVQTGHSCMCIAAHIDHTTMLSLWISAVIRALRSCLAPDVATPLIYCHLMDVQPLSIIFIQ
jgi:hypothetical protein